MVPTKNPRLYIHEVSVRDGFQIEPEFIPTEQKVALVNALSRTGVAKIEVTSFTSPRAIPGLADAEAVMGRIDRVPGVQYAALVPNVRGCERALACQVDEVNVVMSASQSHNVANLRMTPEQSLGQFADIAKLVDSKAFLNASLSTAFGCPFEGQVPLSRVLEMIDRFSDIGIEGVTLCDTTGVGNPRQVMEACLAVQDRWPAMVFTAHFHDTRGMGLANALAALQAGIVRFDASLGGLGGCPFAPGASGNVCTEDLVHMFEAMGCDTGVDLDGLLDLARLLPDIVKHGVPGQVAKAGPSTRRYPLPAGQDDAGQTAGAFCS
ncbi:hydroxymethylglutaryl-CoA lyase [Eoetvoesiella caeni]|uniref:Hydroxymethylglutaryl-CoA lyase n=1 Tax=Eoetvoesiella caeni TaxID=645616 RepID=A0A366HGX9_9BURK|nr:hydroxymethylglutaryl-CoA lyase [Eoetvoesiella caeni]MCI2807994.1 hydroxymethylglutaryl-CoA lyase [Eoetvoesiella caeni]NYT54003.1 hydroxymethylglutaryl-CoA lyase [Eoetvoesiella caeni]RBP41913.1 hydroxymethylglutaryl-CoA lyase [Eoetvoesiella caeni]